MIRIFFLEKRLHYSILVLHLHPQYGTSIDVQTKFENAKIAQLVERDLAKVEVAGSSPVFRSTIINARMVKLVDTLDLKSSEQQCSCGFKSRSEYKSFKLCLELFLFKKNGNIRNYKTSKWLL